MYAPTRRYKVRDASNRRPPQHPNPYTGHNTMNFPYNQTRQRANAPSIIPNKTLDLSFEIAKKSATKIYLLSHYQRITYCRMLILKRHGRKVANRPSDVVSLQCDRSKQGEEDPETREINQIINQRKFEEKIDNSRLKADMRIIDSANVAIIFRRAKGMVKCAI